MSYAKQDLDPRVAQISEILRSGQASDALFQQLDWLQTQADIYRTLMPTAELLIKHPSNSALPGQLATRVRHILTFAYGQETRNHERSVRLRELGCNALKFCGLAFTVREIRTMPGPQFELLIDQVTDFVQRTGLEQHLYRRDIAKALSHESITQNVIIRDFLHSNLNSMPVQGLVDKDRSLHGEESSIVQAGPILAGSQERRDEAIQVHGWSLTGNAFKLSIDDAKEIVQSDQVGSEIILTWPNDLRTSPFVTLPLSNTLAYAFAGKAEFIPEIS